MTDDFHGSDWTDQEVGAVFGRARQVVPVRINDVKPYGFIAKYQAIDARGADASTIARKIFEFLLKRKRARDPMTTALINVFARSNTYAEAKANMTLLEQVHVLTDAQVELLRAAAKGNYQIIEAFGVRDRLNRLIDKIIAKGAE